MRASILSFFLALLVAGLAFADTAPAQGGPPAPANEQVPPGWSPGHDKPAPRWSPPVPPPVNPPNPFHQGTSSSVRVVAPGVLEIDGVRIVKKDNQIEIPCKLALTRGLLEYLLVARSGKAYESLLSTDAQPVSIQLALLLLGLNGTNHPLSRQGDPAKPQGDPVIISVQWKEKGQLKSEPIEKWVMVVAQGGSRMMPPSGPKLQGKTMDPTNWTFTGSMFGQDGAFMAQVEKSIVAIYHDPVALIDNPLDEGGNNRVWFVNEGKTPPVGTEVTVIIKMAGR